MPLSAADYRPRDAEHTVLYRVIDEHLEAFLETARRNADGSPLPEFVEQEFRDFLTCGLSGARLRAPAVHRLRVRAARAVLLQGARLLPELRRPAHVGVRRPARRRRAAA
jgi:hypothetical protein